MNSDSGASSTAQTAIFACCGEFWNVGYRGRSFSLKDAKGLSYIQRLLLHSGEEFHALDLVNLSQAPAAADRSIVDRSAAPDETKTIRPLASSDAGVMLDDQSKREYKRRLLEFQEELEKAQAQGDVERAATIESESDSLKAEIRRAVGLGGRDRRAGVVSERARISVQRAIKGALQKIAEHDAAFGELLDRSIRTGTFCSCAAYLSARIRWQFSMRDLPSRDKAETVGPSQPLLEPNFFRDLSDRTIFVGREPERALLRSKLEAAQRGNGRVVMIVGPPGVGKTRLAAETGAEATKKRVTTLYGSCYDRDDVMPFIPFVEILEAALNQAQNLEVFRQALGPEAAEMTRFLPQLRRLFPEIPAALELPPEQSRRILINAATEILARSARNGPLLLVLDDLQWADDATLGLLTHLANVVANMPVLIVATYRDSDLDPAKPLARALDELIRRHLLEWISLAGLPPHGVAEMLQALSGREPPESLVQLIHSETEGNPFFVEELYWHLAEQGKLMDTAGEFRRDLELPNIDIPQSIRVVIGRRLARLSEGTQKTLGTAAVIGRSLTIELLEASTQVAPDVLLDYVEEAERAGLISSTVQYPEVRFEFSHELIRQVVVSGFSATRARLLHLDVANAMERIYPDTLEDHAEDLAHHLWQAGTAADAGRTVRCLAIAAKRARLQGDYEAAVRYLQNALESLQRLPQTQDRTSQELELTLGLSSVLITSKGFAAAELDNIFARMLKLCDRIEDPTLTFPVQLHIWASVTVRGNCLRAREMSERLLPYAEHTAVPFLAMTANVACGVTYVSMGLYLPGRSHLERALALYDPSFRSAPGMFQDPAVLAMVYLARDLWYLGYPDQAREKANEAIELAQTTQHYHDLAHAHSFAAIVRLYRHEPTQAIEHCRKAIVVAREHSLPVWEGMGMIWAGASLIDLGRIEEGTVQLMEGIRLYTSTGSLTGITYWSAFLAESNLKCGKIREAAGLLNEALELAAKYGEGCVESELYRLRGEALLHLPQPDPESAAISFRKAISVARERGGKSPELRATTSLASLLRTQGKLDEARQMLTEIYSWFGEGFDTGDLKGANSLLQELSS